MLPRLTTSLDSDFFPGKDDVNKYGFLPHGKFN